MARDKLITIRIEGEKRDAFNQLAKSQNTDTASLLYDFISGCLDGTLDISLVTGKGNRLDKIDNQIDSDRLDKLETTTQRLDERLGIITKKLNDWIEAFDDRLTDCDRGLSNRMISLEHRLNALSIQLDSQKIDTIEMTTQEIDMEPLLKREREASIATFPLPTGEPGEGDNPEVSPSPPLPALDAIASIDGTVETVTEKDDAVYEPDSTIKTGPGAIETVNGDNSPINEPEPAIEQTNKGKAAILGIHASNLTKWIKNQEIPGKYLDKCRFNENKTKIILI